MKDIKFLTLKDMLKIASDQVERYGGSSGVRDEALLISAQSMPEAGFDGRLLHKEIFEMAAAYLFHTCCNHPLVDGNKRTALAAALVFLELNGISILDPDEQLYPCVVNVASGKRDKNCLAVLLRSLPRES